MKANKALKRITHAEDLISDVLERYSAEAPEFRQQLLDARAAVGRAKDAVKLKARFEKTSAQRKTATKAVKVRGAKATEKRGTTKQESER